MIPEKQSRQSTNYTPFPTLSLVFISFLQAGVGTASSENNNVSLNIDRRVFKYRNDIYKHQTFAALRCEMFDLYVLYLFCIQPNIIKS